MTRPSTPKPVQLTRCYVALNLVSGLIKVMRNDVEDKKTLAHLAKIQRWLEECANTLERAPKHSASWRISDKLNRQIHLSVIAGLHGDDVSGGDGYAAWVYCIYGYFCDAICTAKDYAKGRAWRFLDQTMTTLAESLYKQFPHGGAIGWQIYLEGEST